MKIKFILIVLPVLIFSISGMLLIKGNNTKSKKNKTQNIGFAIVELFTSEGCSSCPPADEAVASMAKVYPQNVYVLAFHVDYWNHLGWKDQFSDPDYTERQRQYAAFFNNNNIYTPQVIVNGKKEFVGSNSSLLQSTIESELRNTMNNNIKMIATGNDGKNISVNYKVDNSDESQLNIALIQVNASTAVKRGENKGRKLEHINIVRDFKTVLLNKKQSGTVKLTLPAGLSKGNFKVIAFLQHKNDLLIDGVKEIALE